MFRSSLLFNYRQAHIILDARAKGIKYTFFYKAIPLVYIYIYIFIFLIIYMRQNQPQGIEYTSYGTQTLYFSFTSSTLCLTFDIPM